MIRKITFKKVIKVKTVYRVRCKAPAATPPINPRARCAAEGRSLFHSIPKISTNKTGTDNALWLRPPTQLG